jgi:hypothetical protein
MKKRSEEISHPCYSKCGAWASTIRIAWELVRNADSQDTPIPTELKGF